MTLPDIAKTRLVSQQIARTKYQTAKDIVSWMGAMQAQDLSMAKLAVGIRLPGSTEKTVEAAIARGEIIRTHVMRPTWHFVSADDVHWMLELTAPQIRASLKSRHKQLGLTEAIFSKSNSVIEKALAAEKQLDRKELSTALEKVKVCTSDNRIAHLLLRAELDRIICSGTAKGRETTYALLDDIIPRAKTSDREATLGQLAKRYFSSHGPATLQDFVWWSGLSVGDARGALEMARSGLVSEVIDSQTYWLSDALVIPADVKNLVYLLPAFDEFIIGYKDRRAALSDEHHKKAVSNNGVFRPTIVIDGQVEGLWKRTIKKREFAVEADLFQPLSKMSKKSLEKTMATLGHFLGKRPTLST
jgi:hypothetical protein